MPFNIDSDAWLLKMVALAGVIIFSFVSFRSGKIADHCTDQYEGNPTKNMVGIIFYGLIESIFILLAFLCGFYFVTGKWLSL